MSRNNYQSKCILEMNSGTVLLSFINKQKCRNWLPIRTATHFSYAKLVPLPSLYCGDCFVRCPYWLKEKKNNISGSSLPKIIKDDLELQFNTFPIKKWSDRKYCSFSGKFNCTNLYVIFHPCINST